MSGAGEFIGASLGSTAISYDEDDAILYALSVGARATELDLVFERDLRVLPTFALAWGLWAPDALGALGAFDVGTTVHGAQTLVMRETLAPSGTIEMSAVVEHVWDKGSAAVFDIRVVAAEFEAVYVIFAPGSGGFGGDRGPSAPKNVTASTGRTVTASTHPDQAALYRLTGDHHLIHIDPEAAAGIGAERPILHGLCTLAVCVREVAAAVGRSAADVTALEARFSGMVIPGDDIDIELNEASAAKVAFAASVRDRPVLSAASVSFAPVPKAS